MKEGVFNILPF